MKKPNIVLIVIDALRARNLGCYSYDKPTTPNIDKISQQGALFEQCFSTTNVTDPSFTSILSGNYPATGIVSMHGETSSSIYTKKLEGIKFLQSILKTRGYVTIGVDWLGRWHRWGFDHYSGPIEKKMKLFNIQMIRTIKSNKLLNASIEFIKRITSRGIFNVLQVAYDKGNTVTNYALKMLEKYQERNLFLFIHYWDVHIPYDPPRSHLQPFENETYNPKVDRIADMWQEIKDSDWQYFLQRYTKKMKSTREVLARYDGSIHYVDSEIGRIMQKMDELGILDNTLLIVTADHGESLTEHGIYFDHHGLYDELIHVPLIFYYPKKIPAARRIPAVVQHIDLVPTILDLTEINHNSHDFDGKSLLPWLREGEDARKPRPFIYVEEAKTQRKFAIRTDRFKYIFAPSEADAMCSYCGKVHGGREELYDLEQDPKENRNIVNENLEIRAELRERLLRFMAELKSKRERQKLKGRIRRLKAAAKI